MRAVDLVGLRKEIRKAQLSAVLTLQIPVDEVASLADEIEQGRLAVAAAKPLFEAVRAHLLQAAEVDDADEPLQAEVKRVRKDRAEILISIDDLIGPKTPALTLVQGKRPS